MIISKTPLRISCVGGGTDLPEWTKDNIGCVVGGSIDKFVYVILNSRFDDKIYVGYHKQEIVDRVDEIQHDLVRVAARYTKMPVGFEVKTMSDVPSHGSGLGSSSAYLVGLLNAFYTYNNTIRSPLMLAIDAYFLERKVLGRSVGKQDHYFSAIGGKKRFIFSNEIPEIEDIPLTSKNLFLHFTGVTRNADNILKQQTQTIEKNFSLYEQLAQLAINFDPSNLEETLLQNWIIKKQLADNISNPEIETMIDIAISGGATSYKILGAGGGGFLLSYVPESHHEQFLNKMKDYRHLPFDFTNFGTRIIYNGN